MPEQLPFLLKLGPHPYHLAVQGENVASLHIVNALSDNENWMESQGLSSVCENIGRAKQCVWERC